MSESQLLCLTHEVSHEVARPFPICRMAGNIAARSACLGDVLPHLPFVIRALDKFGDMQGVAMVRTTVVTVPPGLPSPFRVPHLCPAISGSLVVAIEHVDLIPYSCLHKLHKSTYFRLVSVCARHLHVFAQA